MSFRGSFVTSFIYDKDTFHLLKKFLDEYHPIACLDDHIICGFIRNGHDESVGSEFESDRMQIENIIKEPIQIAILNEVEEYSKILYFTPKHVEEEQ